MIDLSRGEDVTLVVETATRFAVEVLSPSVREFETAGAVPVRAVAEAAEVGFDAVDWPEDCGGAGLGAVARAQMLEALGGGCAGATLGLLPVGSAAHALLAFGGPEALRRLTARLAGRRVALLYDSRAQLTRSGDRLRGRIPWLPVTRVGALLVLTGDRLLLVEDGIETTPVEGSGLRAAGASDLELHDAPIAAEWHDARAAGLALAHARLHVAALLTGQMRAAADFSREYAQQRVAFGRPIAHHQGLAFLIVDLHAAVETARLLLHEAAWRLDAGVDATAAAAAAFVEAAETALFVGSNAVQILGAAGFTRDYPVEKHLRDLRALGLLLGGADAARNDALGGVSPEPFALLALQAAE